MRARVIISLWVCAFGAYTLAFSQPKKPSQFATFSTLPSFPRGTNSEAIDVNRAGSVIVGHAFDRNGIQWAVRWTLQNGSWVMSPLPTPTDAAYARARAVSDLGDAAGEDWSPGAPRHRAVLWPATGGYVLLGCNEDMVSTIVEAISDDGQTVVGTKPILEGNVIVGSRASVWPAGGCRTDLPWLGEGISAAARAVNRDATVLGGSASATTVNPISVPVRWTFDGLWHIQPLDARPGSVFGSNDVGDLVGFARVPFGAAGCEVADGCGRAVIWYADGGTRDLGTLGGAFSSASGINASREVVGMAATAHVGSTPFIWSASVGMLELPYRGKSAVANAISDVRPDGTRVVVGFNSNGEASVWVVTLP